jgi:UDP-glucose:(heptosyl)LPS alpha-1,3-glucosyltransferase
MRQVSIDQVVMEFSLKGGIEAVAFELQRCFRAMGADSRVVTCMTDDDGADVVRIGGPLRHVGTRGRWRHVGRAIAVPLFSLAATAFLRRPSQRLKARVVLSHGDTLTGDVCVVHSVNRADLDAKRDAGAWRWRLNPLHYWVSARDRWMLRGLRFRRYVALSERVAQELELYYAVPRERVVVIPNGVNLDRFTPVPADRDETRRSLGLSPGAPVLLFVGHEFDRKGLAFVIDALSRLARRDAVLVVAGAGDVRPFARQAEACGLQDRVHFLGPRSDLPSLYRAADAFVLPTRYESFCLVCIEAMACGLPVLATKVGGIEDYLREAVNGHFITRHASEIAATLDRLLADPSALAQLREGALATAAGYEWGRIAARYRQLLEDVQRERTVSRPERGRMWFASQAGQEGV